MEVLRELKENKGIAVALGFFDGVHQGHKKIIQTLTKTAQIEGLKSAVITFDINPANYFNPAPIPNIQTYKDKELIFASLNVDYTYELDFEQLKDLSADEYLENVIIKYFKPKIIVVGYNHTFGKEKQGNGAYLSKRSKEFGYEVIVVPEQKYENKEEISSSIIRKRIESGHLNAVKALLGRNFSVRNSVIKGDRVASTFGYPTANIIWPSSMVKLPYGVYHGYCQTNSALKPALISWGNKPTLSSGNEEILEAHLYDFDEDLYGRIVKVIFVKKVRDLEKFASKNLLKAQLAKDYDGFQKWVKSLSV